MTTSRRSFVARTAGLVGASTLATRAGADMNPGQQDACDLPPTVAALRPMLDGVRPITDAERRGRIEQARRLMAEQGIDALLLEPGTSFSYYLNVSWGLSERPFLGSLGSDPPANPVTAVAVMVT